MRTEYDDQNRIVVVRSDIDAIGDGRKVTSQFYDQLGRVRLTKSLGGCCNTICDQRD